MTDPVPDRRLRRSAVPLEALTPPWWARAEMAAALGPSTSGPSPTAPGLAAAASALVQEVRQAIRQRHYSLRTEKSYAGWVRRFLVFHRGHDPSHLGVAEVRGYLTHLAVRQRVSASTQNQAFSALLFLFREVLGRPLEHLEDAPRAKGPVRLPVILTRPEVLAILARLRAGCG